MNLYIVRHGNPNYSTDHLTELGHKQAEACANAMLDLKIDEIHASPQGRAQETAGHLAEKLGLPIITEPWAHEVEHWVDNGHGGMTLAVQADPTYLRSPEVEGNPDWAKLPVFNGEEGILGMINEIESGAQEMLRGQGYILEGNRFKIADVANPNEKNIALFCHAGMFLVLTSFLLRMPQLTAWHSFFMYQTGITWCNLNNYDSGYTVPRYLYINKTDHLMKDGLPLT